MSDEIAVTPNEARIAIIALDYLLSFLKEPIWHEVAGLRQKFEQVLAG